MNPNDLLRWISQNETAAFWVGAFLLLGAMLAAEFVVRMTRTITGNYPPPDAVYCDADDPCYCCRKNGKDGCDPGCRCHPDEDEDGA